MVWLPMIAPASAVVPVGRAWTHRPPERHLALRLLYKSAATQLPLPRYMHCGGDHHCLGQNRGIRMMRIRSSSLALGAAAFLSGQAAYAAPAGSAVDPLVSLAVLAGGPSTAAVCAGSTAGSAGVAAATSVQGAPGCVLPITAPPSPAPAVVETVPPPPMVAAGAPKAIGTLPLLLGLAAIIGVAALLLSSNGNGHGKLAPISPA